MIVEYNECLSGMKDVDYILLEKDIDDLNKKIETGQSYNLCSTVIKKFVQDCYNKIDQFKSKKKLMEHQATRIQDIVKNISDANLVIEYKFQPEPPTANIFLMYFSANINEVITELA